MAVVIHKGFLAGLEGLSKSDRRRTLTFLDKVQEDPTVAGLRQHDVMNGFTSLSPTMAVRVIAQQVGNKLLMLYVGQHDDAYKWAERHKLLANSASGTFELVTLLANESEASVQITTPAYGIALFERLLSSKIPEYIANGFKTCTSEDELLQRLEPMSPEWQEAIIQAVTGTLEPANLPSGQSSLTKVLTGDELLSDALTYSIQQWRMFLHPKQIKAVSVDHNRVACIVGSPGTGKSVVCAHRAIHLAETLADDEVVVVFTYSINLVKDLRDHIGRLEPSQTMLDRRIWTLPCQNVSERQESGTSISIEGGSVILRHGRLFWKVKHIVVDEFQDSPTWFVDWLQQVKDLTDCSTITVAMDANQSIFRIGHTEQIKRLIDGASVQNLTYCYRMTNSLLENSFAVLSRYTAAYADVVDIGVGFHLPLAVLGGPRVKYVPARTSEDLVLQVKQAVRQLEQRYGQDNSNLVVIHAQYWNPFFAKSGKTDPLAEALKSDPDIGKYYRFAASTKGKEYFAAVVVPNDFMSRDNGRANVMRLNTLYVTLTRARDEMIVVYAEDAPAKLFLPIE